MSTNLINKTRGIYFFYIFVTLSSDSTYISESVFRLPRLEIWTISQWQGPGQEHSARLFVYVVSGLLPAEYSISSGVEYDRSSLPASVQNVQPECENGSTLSVFIYSPGGRAVINRS